MELTKFRDRINKIIGTKINTSQIAESERLDLTYGKNRIKKTVKVTGWYFGGYSDWRRYVIRESNKYRQVSRPKTFFNNHYIHNTQNGK